MKIMGRSEDYYFETETESGEKKYKANREKIRALVALRQIRIREVIANKGNVHQVNLDLNDLVDEFFSTLPVLAKAAVYEVIAEELNASAAASMDEANRLNAKISAEEERANTMGQVIIAVFVLFLMAVIISNL